MEPGNPHAAGDAVRTAQPQQFTGAIAGKGRRFGTMIADYILYYLLCGIVAVVVVLVLGETAVEGLRAYLISLPLFLVYYAGFEAMFGRTPGKFIFGTRVVTNDGRAPLPGQAVGRTLARMIPFEPFSVLFASDDDVVGWHDSIAKTRVIRTR